MKNNQVTLNQTLASAFIVVGAIVISAVIFQYPGAIELRLGPDGGQVIIKGNPKLSNKVEAQRD